MKVYIAGKISGDSGYVGKFAEAERALAEKNISVMNPAWLVSYPEFSWTDYMAVSGAMQKRCDGVYFLPGWQQSRGACIEYERAIELGQKMFFSVNDVSAESLPQ